MAALEAAGLRDRRCRTTGGARDTSSRGCHSPRAPAPAATRRAGRARRLRRLPLRVAARRAARRGSRVARGCSRRSSSSRASSCPRGTGRPGAARARRATTTRRGSTSCASPARWRGCVSRRDRPRTRSAAGRDPVGGDAARLRAREDLDWLLRAVRLGEAPVAPAPRRRRATSSRRSSTRGAQFRAELAASSERLPVEVDEGLWDLVARGIATADAFSAVRSLLDARARFRARQRRLPAARLARAPRRALAGTGVGEGRWSVVATATAAPEGVELEELAERVAIQLLVRWGVVAYELTPRESVRVPWRHVVVGAAAARGARRGRSAADSSRGCRGAVRDARRRVACWSAPRGPRGRAVTLSGSDPINLTGTGARRPAGARRATPRRHRRGGRRDRRGGLTRGGDQRRRGGATGAGADGGRRHAEQGRHRDVRRRRRSATATARRAERRRATLGTRRGVLVRARDATGRTGRSDGAGEARGRGAPVTTIAWRVHPPRVPRPRGLRDVAARRRLALRRATSTCRTPRRRAGRARSQLVEVPRGDGGARRGGVGAPIGEQFGPHAEASAASRALREGATVAAR